MTLVLIGLIQYCYRKSKLGKTDTDTDSDPDSDTGQFDIWIIVE